MNNFQTSKLYNVIKKDDVNEMLNLLNAAEDASLRDIDGSTYLHLAVKEGTSQDLVIELIPFTDITIRDQDGNSALDLLVKNPDVKNAQALIQVFTDYIMNVILDADMDTISHLIKNGWNAWPIRGLDDLKEYKDALDYLHGVTELKEKTIEQHGCVKDGNLSRLQLILENESDAVECDLAGMTILHKAVIFNHMEIVKYLTDHYENLINCKDHMGRTAVHYAAALDGDEIFQFLTPKSDVDLTDKLGNSASFYRENPEKLDISKTQMTISFLLQLPELENKVKEIHDAVIHNDVTKLKELIDHQKLAVVCDSSGMGPLHKAVLYEHADTVQYLLSEYPDIVNSTDNWGRIPLHYAAVVPDESHMYKILTSAGADEEVLDENKKSPKYYLEHKDELNVKKIKELITYLPSVAEYQKSTAKLHAAVVSDDLTRVKNLLSRTGMLETRDATGLTVLHKAVVYEHTDIIRFILASDQQSVNLKDHMGRTPAHYAAALEDKGYISKLLNSVDADITIKDVAGNTPDFYSENKSMLDMTALKGKLAQPLPLMLRPVFEARPPSSGRSKPSSRTGSRADSSMAIQKGSDDEVEGNATFVRTVHVKEDPYVKLNAPVPTTDEARYLAQSLGIALTMSLKEIAELRPLDPIEYLAHSLYKYANNIQYLEKQAEIIERTQYEQELHEMECRRKEKCKAEKNARLKEEEDKKMAEEVESKRVEAEEDNESKRRDDLLAQVPHMPTLKEEEEEDATQIKDEYGETELHKMAQTPDGNIQELLHQRFNIADRNINGKTARDLAEKAELTTHVEAIDDYVVDLFRREQFGAINQLITDGYHSHLPNFTEKLGQEHIDEKTKEILKEMDNYQEKIHEVQVTIEEGNLEKALQLLDRKELAECKDERGRTPLHHIVLGGDLQIIKSFLSKFPATVTTKDNMNRTPLHYAYAVSEEIAEELIGAGANTVSKDAKQRLPIYYKDKREELDD